MGLVKPGGIGLLVTDFVSSLTCPELLNIAERDLMKLGRRLIEAGNFFTGVSPVALWVQFSARNSPDSCLDGVRLLKPWLWDTGYAVYAVCGVRFRMRQSGHRD
jgi:hypothetical protein